MQALRSCSATGCASSVSPSGLRSRSVSICDGPSQRRVRGQCRAAGSLSSPPQRLPQLHTAGRRCSAGCPALRVCWGACGHAPRRRSRAPPPSSPHFRFGSAPPRPTATAGCLSAPAAPCRCVPARRQSPPVLFAAAPLRAQAQRDRRPQLRHARVVFAVQLRWRAALFCEERGEAWRGQPRRVPPGDGSAGLPQRSAVQRRSPPCLSSLSKTEALLKRRARARDATYASVRSRCSPLASPCRQSNMQATMQGAEPAVASCAPELTRRVRLPRRSHVSRGPPLRAGQRLDTRVCTLRPVQA